MSWNDHYRFKCDSAEPVIFSGLWSLVKLQAGQDLDGRRGRALMEGDAKKMLFLLE